MQGKFFFLVLSVFATFPLFQFSKANAATSKKIVDIALGQDSSCALLEDGTVKCWGYNGNGSIGSEDSTNLGSQSGQMGSNLPAVNLGSGRTALSIANSSFHTCAILDNKSLKCWGYNDYGQLGIGDTTDRGDQKGQMGDSLPAIDLGKNRTPVLVAPGYLHTCALLDNNAVKCWGDNSSGELGVPTATEIIGDQSSTMGDNLVAVNLGTNKKVTALKSGAFFSCALIEDGSVICWGTNEYGAVPRGLSDGSADYHPYVVPLGTGRTAKSLVGGNFHACAQLDDNSVKCWGYNSAGQLGLGDATNRGDVPNQMGDTLPVVSIAPQLDVQEISCGGLNCCARLSNNAVKCWGANSSGNLGVGDSSSRGGMPGQMGDDLPFTDLGTAAIVNHVYTGGRHNCALLADGNLKCWGANTYGELGLGDTRSRGSSASDMGNALPALDL